MDAHDILVVSEVGGLTLYGGESQLLIAEAFKL